MIRFNFEINFSFVERYLYIIHDEQAYLWCPDSSYSWSTAVLVKHTKVLEVFKISDAEYTLIQPISSIAVVVSLLSSMVNYD